MMKRFNLLLIALLLTLLAADFLGAQVRRRPLFSTSWTPPSQSGLQVWMKGDAGTTGASSDGDAASDWVDQSGNGNSVTQATSGKRPLLKTGANGINNLPVLQFDGTDDEMDLSSWTTSGTSWTMFAVWGFTGTEATYSVVDLRAIDSYWRFSGDGNGYFGQFVTVRVEGYPATMPTTGNHYIVARATSGGNYEVYLDGVSKGTSSGFTFASPNVIRIGYQPVSGADKHCACKIAEWGAYNVDSSTLRDNLNTYMASKYGL